MATAITFSAESAPQANGDPHADWLLGAGRDFAIRTRAGAQSGKDFEYDLIIETSEADPLVEPKLRFTALFQSR